MRNQLDLLKELQEIDQEINSIEDARQGYREELKTFEAEAARIQDMLSQLNEEVAELQQEEGQLLQELQKGRDNIVRVESRLPEIQTQKEYVAVLKEIDMAKKSNKELEDQLQTKKQQVSALDEDRKEKETQLAGVDENAQARGAELDELLAESETRLAQRNQTRQSLAESLPSPLLRKYQTLFKRRGGLALAMARDGACLGCNMQLPPQQFNQLLRVSELQTCPHCNRILYVERDD